MVSTLSTPVPQEDEKDDDSELKDLLKTFEDREEEEVVASEEEVSSDEGTDDKVSEKLDEVEENDEDEVKEKKDDDENEEEFDALKAIGDAFAGFLRYNQTLTMGPYTLSLIEIGNRLMRIGGNICETTHKWT